MFKIIRNLKERKRIEKELNELKKEYNKQRFILNDLLRFVDELKIDDKNLFYDCLVEQLQNASDSLIRKEVDILELELHLEDLK